MILLIIIINIFLENWIVTIITAKHISKVGSNSCESNLLERKKINNNTKISRLEELTGTP
jgi:hypothetical protein